MRLTHRVLVAITVPAVALVASAAGCGGGKSSGSAGTGGAGTMSSGTGATAGAPSSGSATGGGTASSSGSDGSGGASASASSSGATSSSSGGAACSVDDAACQNNSSNGLCKGGACSACTDATDDAACQAAYGSSTMPFICLGGACAPGNCRADTDCATGEICGLAMPNVCGKCSSDGQCQGDPTYAGDVCATATGLCVPGACTANSAACPLNSADFCCALACIPGNCCTSADCTNSTVCQGHTCTTCALVTNGTYYVDPKKGDDTKATGSGATGGGCAFQTITRALQFIGAAPAAGTKIAVLTTAPVSSTSTPKAEVFPIVVPANVTISGSGGTATVNVPVGKSGFELTGAASGLSALILDGTGLAGTTGIVATTGSAATTVVSGVTVQNMGGDGIDVTNKGILTLRSGVVSTKNGTAAQARSGLRIENNGHVTITVNTGEVAAAFGANTQHGIIVQEAGSITIGGTLDPAVIASANGVSGLYIAQTPSATPPANVIANFQADSSVTGNGIHVFGGSSLKLRTSVTKQNKVNGIFLTSYVGGGTKNDSMAQVDLGTATDFGHNTFQLAAAAGPNGGAGICVNLTPAAAQALRAAGNVFEAAQCFAAGTPGPIKKTAACTGGTDVAITGAATTNTIVSANCAQN